MRLEILWLRKKPTAYSTVVETPQRRAGFTNKPKVVPHYESQPRTLAEKREDVPDQDQTEERDPLSRIDLKDSPSNKTRPE